MTSWALQQLGGPALALGSRGDKGAQSRHGAGEASLSSHCLGFLGREDGSSLPGSYSEGLSSPAPEWAFLDTQGLASRNSCPFPQNC